jgi:hypothetical protein
VDATRLIAIVVVAGCGGHAPPTKTSPSRAIVAEEAAAALPAPAAATGDHALLVVTGYSAELDDIASADLARDYCAGAILVVEAARAAADARFGCSSHATIASLDERARDAKSLRVVTDLDHVSPTWKALTVDGISLFARPHDYPLVIGGADFEPHLTHFIMTGVTAITRASGAACDQHGIDWLTRNLRPQFEGADYVHISNEVSIKADCEYPTKGTYTFCSKERDFQALLDLHANVIELTGNHNRDFGDEPFRQTLAWYGKHDMKTFGGGDSPEAAAKPLVLPLADGKQLGILGYNEVCPLKECAKRPNEVGANPYDRDRARAAIAQLREQHVDVILVTVQWREWDKEEPTAQQTRIAHDLVDAGADLVYGSQAHQLQYIEFYSGRPIFYGLGNLLFDQIHRVGVRQAYFLHHYFFGGRLVQSVPVFTWMSDERQPTIATPEQAAAMKAVVFKDALLYR